MEKVCSYIDQNKDTLCSLLKELVKVPTVNLPGTHYEDMVGFLEERCQTMGMQTQVVRVPEGEAQKVVPDSGKYPRLNLIARWDVGAKKTVHFNGHYDVVPPSGKWRTDPFDPQIQGDWLYGRGSDDMKDSIAALLFAIATLKEKGIKPAFNIECSFTCDEEIGGDLGVGYIVRKGLVQADYVVNCEGGNALEVGCGHNGVLWLEVTVHGKAAHASQPEKGINALEKMAELVMALQPLKKQFAKPKRVFKTPSGVERHPTVNIGGVFGGTSGDKVNTVPAQVSFSIDRRILPNETLRDAEGELRMAIKKASESISGAKIKVKSTLGIEPCIINPDNRFAREFCDGNVLARDLNKSDKDSILNWAFLVPRHATAEFHARMDLMNRDYGPEGLGFELSGPWPPYSFSPPLISEPES